MPEYLIDAYSMASFWVTADNEEEAINEVKGLTHGLDLRVNIGRKKPVILIDVTCRDDNPEVIDVCGDDEEFPEDD